MICWPRPIHSVAAQRDAPGSDRSAAIAAAASIRHPFGCGQEPLLHWRASVVSPGAVSMGGLYRRLFAGIEKLAIPTEFDGLGVAVVILLAVDACSRSPFSLRTATALGPRAVRRRQPGLCGRSSTAPSSPQGLPVVLLEDIGAELPPRPTSPVVREVSTWSTSGNVPASTPWLGGLGLLLVASPSMLAWEMTGASSSASRPRRRWSSTWSRSCTRDRTASMLQVHIRTRATRPDELLVESKSSSRPSA